MCLRKKKKRGKTMNIERTYPYLNTQMTLANKKRKKETSGKIKKKPIKKRKKRKSYDQLSEYFPT